MTTTEQQLPDADAALPAPRASTDDDFADVPAGQAGQLRTWILPADPDAKPALDTLHRWIDGTITGPWGFPQELAQRASAAISALLSGAPRPAAVELRRVGDRETARLQVGVSVVIDPADDGSA